MLQKVLRLLNPKLSLLRERLGAALVKFQRSLGLVLGGCTSTFSEVVTHVVMTSEGVEHSYIKML